MTQYQPMQIPFVVTYETIHAFDHRLLFIENGVAMLLARDTENAALHAEIEALKASGKLTEDELAALKIRVATAVGRTQKLEDKEAAATPNS